MLQVAGGGKIGVHHRSLQRAMMRMPWHCKTRPAAIIITLTSLSDGGIRGAELSNRVS